MIRLAIAALIVVLPLAAQTSSLQGVVTDPQGSAIPAAIVTITNTDTSTARKGVTDDAGAYTFLQVPPGKYKVEIQKPGFTTKMRGSAAGKLAGNFESAEWRLARPRKSLTSLRMRPRSTRRTRRLESLHRRLQIVELPLQTRNVVALLSVEPGVSSTGQVLGARPDQNNVTLDGANVNDNRGANGFTAVLPIPLDSVQEFRTTIAGQGADRATWPGGRSP